MTAPNFVQMPKTDPTEGIGGTMPEVKSSSSQKVSKNTKDPNIVTPMMAQYLSI